VTLTPTESSTSGDRIPHPDHERPAVPAWRLVSLHWLILALVAVAETSQMWAPALLAGHSAWMDLARLVEFDTAIRAGDFLPLWSPDFYHGYGSPLFQFYAPLAYYLAELPVLAGFDFPTALKITQLLALFASGVAMYQLAARRFSGWAACWGGVLYMVAPYRLVDMFVRHALAEHCAFVWLPLIVLGTERFVAQRSRWGLALGIFTAAGLVLTHNVMALIGLPVCVAAGWVLGARTWSVQGFILAGVPALLGLGLAAFFWWPALSGRPLTFAEESLTGGYFDFRNHFVDVRSFLSVAWSFGESGPQTAEPMPRQIGWPHLLAGAGAIFLLVAKWRGAIAVTRPQTAWLAVGLAIMTGAILMCHAVSQPIWSALPLVKYVQFPWRFLGLAVFGAALCGAAAVHGLSTARPQWELPISVAGLVVVMAACFPYYSEARFLAVDGRTNKLVQATPDHLGALEAIGALVPVAGLVTPETIRATGERATSSDDFLPRNVQEKPTQSSAALVLAVNGELRRTTRAGFNHYRTEVVMREPGRVELQQFWFPGWTAWMDGREIETAPFGKTGVVSCAVPVGEHRVEFRYLGLPQRREGLIISWLSAAVAALAIGGIGCFGKPEGAAL